MWSCDSINKCLLLELLKWGTQKTGLCRMKAQVYSYIPNKKLWSTHWTLTWSQMTFFAIKSLYVCTGNFYTSNPLKILIYPSSEINSSIEKYVSKLHCIYVSIIYYFLSISVYIYVSIYIYIFKPQKPGIELHLKVF